MILKCFYKLTHKGIKEDDIPYWWKRTILQEILHFCQKIVCQNIAPNCVTNYMRVRLYRLCGFKVGGALLLE